MTTANRANHIQRMGFPKEFKAFACPTWPETAPHKRNHSIAQRARREYGRSIGRVPPPAPGTKWTDR